MIKEAKNVDFYTIGRQPSEQDFDRIGEWIKKDKEKRATRKNAQHLTAQKHNTQSQRTGLKAGHELVSLGFN